jgi:hypothetical protein
MSGKRITKHPEPETTVWFKKPKRYQNNFIDLKIKTACSVIFFLKY